MCDNCPARNNRVREYLVEGQRKDLCMACLKAAADMGLALEHAKI